jgi:AraC-like DNA-binding protein
MEYQRKQSVFLMKPPYLTLNPAGTNWQVENLPLKGIAVVWFLHDARSQESEFAHLRIRPPGMPLFVVLPHPEAIPQTMPMLTHVSLLQPRALIPEGELSQSRHLRRLLSEPPNAISWTVVQYLFARGLLPSHLLEDVRKIFECVPRFTSVTKVARRLYLSRRTLGRHFLAAGIPVPSHWLQFARLLNAALVLQKEQSNVLHAALRAGYPDGFTLSNQMKRLIDCRPTEVRAKLGWEWIIESWIRRETSTGGFDVERYRSSIQYYLSRPDNGGRDTR